MQDGPFSFKPIISPSNIVQERKTRMLTFSLGWFPVTWFPQEKQKENPMMIPTISKEENTFQSQTLTYLWKIDGSKYISLHSTFQDAKLNGNIIVFLTIKSIEQTVKVVEKLTTTHTGIVRIVIPTSTPLVNTFLIQMNTPYVNAMNQTNQKMIQLQIIIQLHMMTMKILQRPWK